MKSITVCLLRVIRLLLDHCVAVAGFCRLVGTTPTIVPKKQLILGLLWPTTLQHHTETEMVRALLLTFTPRLCVFALFVPGGRRNLEWMPRVKKIMLRKLLRKPPP
jgi:hypothetical protein